MTALYDPWTGKPVDRLSDFLPSLAGYQCDECGAEVINRCLRCGAPQCCPRCCYDGAQGIEAQRAETAQTGSVHESPVAESDAPNPNQQTESNHNG